MSLRICATCGHAHPEHTEQRPSGWVVVVEPCGLSECDGHPLIEAHVVYDMDSTREAIAAERGPRAWWREKREAPISHSFGCPCYACGRSTFGSFP